jgi:hypothetical protein
VAVGGEFGGQFGEGLHLGAGQFNFRVVRRGSQAARRKRVSWARMFNRAARIRAGQA